jgi:4-amino-4-deoxy-L-arabinose transferase-like glycosyltransferase
MAPVRSGREPASPADGTAPRGRRAAWWLAALLALVAVVRLVSMAPYPLVDPSESRYAEIAREMVAGGDWISPQLEPGVPFWGKPPLSFWLTAASFRVFGPSAWAARLAPFAFLAASVAFVFAFAAVWLDRRRALLAALVLSSSALFFVLAGTVSTDAALVFVVTAALASLPRALLAPEPRRRRAWALVFFAALGLSPLAKGLVGPVWILGVVGLWGAFARAHRRALARLPWGWGLALAAALAVPWHLLAELRTPGFLHYYLWGEHVQRFLVEGWAGDRYGNPHPQPPGAILLFFAAAALPWSAIAAWIGLRRLRGGDRPAPDPGLLWVGLWLVVPLGFFVLSSNVMLAYALPALPPFALLTARLLGAPRREGGISPWLAPRRLAATTLAVPALVLVASLAVFPFLEARRSQRDLVQLFEQLDTTGRATLVYTDEMPPSGDFYARGRAIEIHEDDAASIERELRDDDLDFYAIEDNDADQFPALGLERTREVGRVGRYRLRVEEPAPRAAEGDAAADAWSAGSS